MKSEGQPRLGLESEMTTHTNNPEQKAESFEYRFFPDKQQRILLGKAVEDVIDHVVSVHEQEEQKEGGLSEPPNVIFLDKSARPLSTMFLELWSKKHPDKARPNISFLNIGRELIHEEPTTWTQEYKPIEGKQYFEMTPAIEREIERIKNQYTHLKEAPAGGTIVIIDDVCKTGLSRDAALAILKKAFPNLKFEYHALAEARDKTVEKEEYDRSSPQLFDNLRMGANVLGFSSGEPVVGTEPPWVHLGWPGISPKGVTGVADDPKRVSLTVIPYYRDEYYSSEKKAKRTKRYTEYKKNAERVLELAVEACQEIVRWEPSIIVKDPPSYVQEILDDLKKVKDACVIFLKMSPVDIDKVSTRALRDIFYSLICERKTYFCRDKFGLSKEICDFLGFILPLDMYERMKNIVDTREGSVSEKLSNAFHFFDNPQHREDFELDRKETKIDEMIKALRQEMKQIANEYWAQKIQK